MKKGLLVILYILIIGSIIDHKLCNDYVNNYISSFFTSTNYKLVYDSNSLDNENKYKEYTSNVKNTIDFNIKNKNEILDIYYTILNNGVNDFSFYCDENYKECLDDISSLSKDEDKFSYINSLVHPYNSFKTINSNMKSNSRIDITINKKYSTDDIYKIENKINEIINTLNINNYSTVEEKIKVFHDYIVNTNKYDKLKEQGNSTYHSDSAIGTLFEGYSVCSGYTDTMAIFLTKLGLDNVKVITEHHTWNAVKINDIWYHIDLTWDDPINSLDKDILSHDYFLIRTNELLNKDLTEHNFDRNLYEFIN